LYDGGVAYTDRCVGDLFAILRQLGLYDKSLIILTSDHGEEFREHGFMLHSNPCYYEELVRVPMIMKLPGTAVAGKLVTGLIESIDIMPSILALLTVSNVPRMQGDSFIRLIDDPQAQGKDIVFGYTVKDGPRAFARSSRWKLLTPNIQHDQQFKMFDLSSDPQEKLEITGNPGGVTEQLKAKLLDKYMKLEKPGPQEKVSITPEQLEMLKSLGYVQ
jgi:arylsulfatase A-like enzyme